ncbi:MAG: AmmeMemoRadiSam system protein A, partial [Pseudomonadota bacterium]
PNSHESGIERVVILSDARQGGLTGLAVPGSEALATPLGTLPMDAAAAALCQLEDVTASDDAFAQEPAIEVQLPLLQQRIGHVPVLPLLVGEISDERLDLLLDAVWGGRETLVVVATNLGEGDGQAEGKARDLRTARLIEAGDLAGLSAGAVSAPRALGGVIRAAKARGMVMTRLALTRAQSSQDGTSQTGYGTWMGRLPGDKTLPDDLRKKSLAFARLALESRLNRGLAPKVNPDTFEPPFRSHRSCYVTLKVKDAPRGEAGEVTPLRAMISDIVGNCVKAGFEDKNFAPMTEEVFERVKIELSLLSPPVRLKPASETELLRLLVPGRDGLMLAAGERETVFLPKLWQRYPTPATFWFALKRATGLPEYAWSESFKISRFGAESFEEA